VTRSLDINRDDHPHKSPAVPRVSEAIMTSSSPDRVDSSDYLNGIKGLKLHRFLHILKYSLKTAKAKSEHCYNTIK
jgi:hypothetical protein